MSWYLSVAGAVSGPYDEATILEQIRKGLIRSAMIRDLSGHDWQPLDVHPAFADALRRYSPTIRLSKPPQG